MSTTAPAGRGSLTRFLKGPGLLLLPASAIVLVLTGWPLLQLIIMSFQEFGRAQIFGAAPEWVGLANYRAILGDPEFWAVLGRSLALAAVNVVTTMGLGMLIAALMTKLATGWRILVSVGLLLAWAMPPLSATTVMGWIFDTRSGLVNHVLTQLTGDDWSGHSWLYDPLSFYFVATIIITWQSVPFVAFTTYAALTQVSTEMLEAASLDGASGLRRFRLIVMPIIRPVIVVLLILQIIWDLRVFTQIYTLQTIGGLREATNTIGTYIYQVSTAGGDLGTGGAIAVVLVLLVLGLTGFYLRSVLKEEEL